MPKSAGFPPKLIRLEMSLWEGMVLYGGTDNTVDTGSRLGHGCLRDW